MTDIGERLGDVPLVAILRAPDPARFLPVVEVLYHCGMRAVEITLTTAGAVECIQELRSSMPSDLLVGAGSLRSSSDLLAAHDAGAQFVVSQFASVELRDAADALGVDYIPGALTPTEVALCRAAGAAVVKLSPVGPVGGIAYLVELLAPMPDARIFVTGGVKVDDVVGYVDAGAAVVGLSRDLLRDALSPDGDLAALAGRARTAVDAVMTRSLSSRHAEAEVGL
jgi:2-dehydro-3-deoxyphosphogluconate aldolase/(4S)-4-hydroxy-2-oxoglutarate aldolase